MELIVEESNEKTERIDQFLTVYLKDISRSRLQSLIKDGHIKLNGKKTKPSQPISIGDSIQITIPPLRECAAKPERIDLDILFEDSHIIVVNKPHGLVVHPAAGNQTGTLVNALLHHCKELSGIGGVERPGIVHRLDKDTSGCLVAAKSDASHKALVEDFSNRKINKIYLAVVDGLPALGSGRIENHIARDPRDRQKMSIVQPPRGKTAITEYETKIESKEASLVMCKLLTGRTHQIRVHMKSLGNPILGDPIYSRISKQKIKVGRLMLHAWKLGFTHPITGVQLEFTSDLPKEFSAWADFN
tara:strand:- start:19 stop:924 length:906 start_codon:yes stop_codon:yes gene_type:complete